MEPLRRSVIAVTVYEPAQKQGTTFKPVTINRKVCRRVTVQAQSSVPEIVQKLGVGVGPQSVFVEIKHVQNGSEEPVDSDEFTADDVAKQALGFAQKQITEEEVMAVFPLAGSVLENNCRTLTIHVGCFQDKGTATAAQRGSGSSKMTVQVSSSSKKGTLGTQTNQVKDIFDKSHLRVPANSEKELDAVLIEHWELRKKGVEADYTTWLAEKCPMMVPFTPARGVTISGLGCFQGGTSVLKNIDQECKDGYYRDAVQKTGLSEEEVKIICKNRQNSVLSNRDEKEGHLDVKFSKHTSAWMDTWGPRIVARHLAHKSFKVPDWCIDDLLAAKLIDAKLAAEVKNLPMPGVSESPEVSDIADAAAAPGAAAHTTRQATATGQAYVTAAATSREAESDDEESDDNSGASSGQASGEVHVSSTPAAAAVTPGVLAQLLADPTFVATLPSPQKRQLGLNTKKSGAEVTTETDKSEATAPLDVEKEGGDGRDAKKRKRKHAHTHKKMKPSGSGGRKGKASAGGKENAPGGSKGPDAEEKHRQHKRPHRESRRKAK